MEVLRIVLAIIHIIFCVVLSMMVLFQSGKSSGLSGAIGGGSDSYTFQAKSKTIDAKLSRWTKWVALIFILLTFSLSLV